MDRTDVGRREERALPGGASPPIADPEAELWRTFGEAATPETFYRAWLALQCRQIHGTVGGVIVIGAADTGPYAPAAFWPDRARNLRHLAEVAERAMTERRGLVIPRPARREGDPTERPRYDVAYPIEVGGKLYGVVALDVAPRQPRDLQPVLRQLQWGAAWLEVMVLRGDVGTTVAVRDRLQTALGLVATPLVHEGFRAGATAFVTTVATRLGCDRVSVGFVDGGRARVHAVSHSAQFGEKSNLVRAIGAAMDEAVDQGATVIYPAPADRPAQVTHMHAELARVHGSTAICTVPLTSAGRVVGALTLERPTIEPGMVELCEALAGMAGPVLELQRRDDRWLPRKALDSLRRGAGAIIGPHHLALKAGIVVAALVVAFLAVATGDFRIAARTTVEPIVRQAAVAPFGGYVAEAPARAGDVVRKGQLLARLDDRDLKLERLKRLAQYEQVSRQHAQAMAARNAAQVVILAAQLEQVRAELALVEEQLRHTRLEAPFDGIVVVGDLSQSLAAPVERGQVLFEVAPLDAYRLMVDVDERDVAWVAVGQRGMLVLTGAPADPIGLRVEKITPVSTPREAHNYFRVEAKLDDHAIALRPGMEGVAKIEVGHHRLVWIWTRQILDWIRLQLWTWLP